MSKMYRFHKKVVLRTPSLPFKGYVDEAMIFGMLTNDYFMESIYLASPALHEECIKLCNGKILEEGKLKKIYYAITRYYTRMYSRSTPFGLFAGCTTIEWDHISSVKLERGRHKRHTRLDMHYLCLLAHYLATHEELKYWLNYQPNSSIYRIGSEVRYIEQSLVGSLYVHQTSAIEASEPLLYILAAASKPQPLANLKAVLHSTEEPPEVIDAFIEELVNAQVLVSELEPTVTGVDFFNHILTVVRRIAKCSPTTGVQAIVQLLETVKKQLASLDNKYTNLFGEYQFIAETLATLGVPIEANKLFQTDLISSKNSNSFSTWSKSVQSPLYEALKVLTYLTQYPGNTRLIKFAHRFHDRYEDREVPLLEALDMESGVAYLPYNKTAYSSLVHDIVVSGPSQESVSSQSYSKSLFLERKIQYAARHHLYSIDITREELLADGFNPGVELPLPSIGLLFREVTDDQVLLEGVSGSSAANLLGRFAYAAPDIERLIQEIAYAEQQHNPNVVFAEICHLPSARIGNILQRPHFRDLEIPYLAQSTLPYSKQVRVNDLRLSLRKGQFILRSALTDQIIIPRLSTAHNFAIDALPVYHFLCDLQTQDLRSHLGSVWLSTAGRAQFMPRLTYNKVILELASWQLYASDLAPIINCPADELQSKLAELIDYWKLPRLFILVDNDNELLVDTNSQQLVNAWVDIIRGRSMILLKEFLFNPDTSSVHDNSGKPYVPQLLAILMRQSPCYFPPSTELVKVNATITQQEFFPGSEWVYYKVYCGSQAANRLLVNAIGPITQALVERKWINSWFFVRYTDPDFHLRIRWNLSDNKYFGEVVELISMHLRTFCDDGTIWKMQLDTYRRELERYGTSSITLTESLFHYHSTKVLMYLTQENSVEDPNEMWLWGLQSMDELLNAFVLSLDEKIVLLQKLRNDFAQEFNMDKSLKRQLDIKYRAQRGAIEQVMNKRRLQIPQELKFVNLQLDKLDEQHLLEIPKKTLLNSYLHMFLNRLIPANARLHELVLYHFLLHYYIYKKNYK